MPREVICQICTKSVPRTAALPGEIVRESIATLIAEHHPSFTRTGFICLTDLNRFRDQYIQKLLAQERGELTNLENEVVEALRQHEILSANPSAEFEKDLTFGERMSDRIATFGGSWKFIILFFVFLFSWIGINSIAFFKASYDPFPFILLNLLLSCVAAIQAPIIMMSQNRQEAKDRLRGEHDYKVNLKAELEIRLLSEKIDRLLTHQWQRLLEIQQIQLDLMKDVSEKQHARRERRAPRVAAVVAEPVASPAPMEK